MEKFDTMAVSPSGQKAPVRVYSMTKNKIPISLVLVLVFMVFVMLFLHIDYHLYYFFLLFNNCSMYQAGKGV